MNTATNKMKTLVAGGAAFAAFGIGIMLPAQADSPAPSPTGEVGQAWLKANPPGQSQGDKNRGFTCDGNRGAGQGNPALNPVCGTDPYVTPTTPPGSTPPPPGGDTGADT
jgi:hypothetical protein